MQTNLLSRSSASDSLFSAARRNPPAHVRRWTGRAQMTIPLPSLAALRLSASSPVAASRSPAPVA